MLFKRGYIGGIKGAILLLFIDLEMIFFLWGGAQKCHSQKTFSEP